VSDGYYRAPYTWWRNGLGWFLFVVAPACGFALGLAVGVILWR